MKHVISRSLDALQRAIRPAAAAAALALVCLPAAAQNLFAPALHVNDRVITNFDIAQRMRFLEVLNVGATDLRAEAIRRLTEESVQAFHARRAGVRVNRAELTEGVAEFAARANLPPEAFLVELSRAGVDEAAFREFVEIGLQWRQMVRARFLPRLNVTDAEIDRALSVSAIRGSMRVLMSEIFLPSDAEFAEIVAEIIPQILELRDPDAFSDAAREVSIAATRDEGGRLDWLGVDALPPVIAAQVRDASPGTIIGPIEVPGAFGIFQVRALDTRRDIPADRIQVVYQQLLLPGARSDANMARLGQIRARVQRCTDISAFARDLPANALSENTALVRALPQEIALELARLDENETSANMVQGDNLVVLMLCSRTLQFDEPLSRSQVADRLRDERLNRLAENWLAELLADADIRRP